jgi:hypothetical protein
MLIAMIGLVASAPRGHRIVAMNSKSRPEIHLRAGFCVVAFLRFPLPFCFSMLESMYARSTILIRV